MKEFYGTTRHSQELRQENDANGFEFDDRILLRPIRSVHADEWPYAVKWR
jgi:hypothetical protein